MEWLYTDELQRVYNVSNVKQHLNQHTHAESLNEDDSSSDESLNEDDSSSDSSNLQEPTGDTGGLRPRYQVKFKITDMGEYQTGTLRNYGWWKDAGGRYRFLIKGTSRFQWVEERYIIMPEWKNVRFLWEVKVGQRVKVRRSDNTKSCLDCGGKGKSGPKWKSLLKRWASCGIYNTDCESCGGTGIIKIFHHGSLKRFEKRADERGWYVDFGNGSSEWVKTSKIAIMTARSTICLLPGNTPSGNEGGSDKDIDAAASERRRRLLALSERLQRVRDFQASTEM